MERLVKCTESCWANIIHLTKYDENKPDGRYMYCISYTWAGQPGNKMARVSRLSASEHNIYPSLIDSLHLLLHTFYLCIVTILTNIETKTLGLKCFCR